MKPWLKEVFDLMVNLRLIEYFSRLILQGIKKITKYKRRYNNRHGKVSYFCSSLKNTVPKGTIK